MNLSTNWRDRRNFLAPPHYTFASYCTDTKTDMKNTFGEELFLNNLYLGPDPLRKNLADTLITEEKMATKNGKTKLEKEETKVEENAHMHEDYSPLTGITNFFSGVLNVITNAMFSKRKPADFRSNGGSEMAVPPMWHGANLSDENKILQDEFSDDMSSEVFASEMSDCKSAAAHCKSKLEQVRVLLGSSKPVPCSLRVRRRPKKVFVEPGSVEDCFEDAFSPEDFENLANDSYIEFSSPVCYHEHIFHEIDGPKTKDETAVLPKVTETLKVDPVTPKAVSQTPKVAPELPKVVPKSPKVVPKTSKVIPETHKVVLDTTKVVPELNEVVPEMTKVTSQTPTVIPVMTEKLSESPKLASEKTNLSPKTPDVADTPPKVPEQPKIVNKVPNIVSQTSQTITKAPTFDCTEACNSAPETVAEDTLICEKTEIVKNVPELITSNDKLGKETTKELVESCDDKITKLKLLLQERRKKSKVVVEPQPEEPVAMLAPIKLEPEPQPLVKLPPRPKPSNKVKDKRFKNPNRTNDKRRRSRMRRNIHDDALFANDLHSEDLSSSIENSPSSNNMENYIGIHQNLKNCTPPQPVPCKEYFDEVSGRFHSASVDSEDSFQIVFNDSPKVRRPSECDSEDSFIVFEDSPDSCYTSNDVFGDTTDSEDYDSDSDMSDSGCGTFKLSASLSKSVSNLADDSLYMDHSEDEVDCANVQHDMTDCDRVTVSCVGDSGDSKGLLVDERKKLLRKDLPAKQVHFSPLPPKVHVMRVWLYAAKQTRVRYWEQFVTDRERFKRRIADVDMAVSWVLKPQHRSRVMFQRFMPWWNAQKRKEIAEKKEREAQEKLKEERLRNEEIERQKAESNNTATDISETKEGAGEEILVENTVEVQQDSSNKEGERRVDNDSLVIKEINCQNSKEENTGSMEKGRDNKSVSMENTKNINKSLDDKLYSNQILPYNEKILDLNPEYVSGILKT